MLNLIRTVTGCMTLLPLIAALNYQQTPPTNRQAPPPGQPQAGAPHMQSDQELAQWLAFCNVGEISLAKWAADQTSDKDVQKFAEMLVKDHEDFQKSLEKFGARVEREEDARREPPREPAQAERPAAAPGAAPAQAQPQPVARQPVAQGQAPAQGQFQGQPAARPPHAVAGGLNFLMLKHEIDQAMGQAIRKDLERRKGAEFDDAFVGFQIASHIHAVETMKVFRKHASPQFQQVLSEGIKTTEHHLADAQKLMEQLADKSAGSTASKEKDSDKK